MGPAAPHLPADDKAVPSHRESSACSEQRLAAHTSTRGLHVQRKALRQTLLLSGCDCARRAAVCSVSFLFEGLARGVWGVGALGDGGRGRGECTTTIIKTVSRWVVTGSNEAKGNDFRFYHTDR